MNVAAVLVSAVLASGEQGSDGTTYCDTVYFIAAAAALLVSVALTLIRALAGPTVFDRILAVNAMGTTTVVLVGVLGFMNRRPDFLDVAVVYALINFVATVALLKYIATRRLG